MLGNVKTFIIYILNIFLLVAGISGILYFTAHYKATETAEITGTKNNKSCWTNAYAFDQDVPSNGFFSIKKHRLFNG